MSRFTSTERQGTVALVGVIAIVVGYMALSRGMSGETERLPEALVESAQGAATGGKPDTLQAEKQISRKESKANGRKKRGAKSGAKRSDGGTRGRDYLNELIDE